MGLTGKFWTNPGGFSWLPHEVGQPGLGLEAGYVGLLGLDGLVGLDEQRLLGVRQRRLDDLADALTTKLSLDAG